MFLSLRRKARENIQGDLSLWSSNLCHFLLWIMCLGSSFAREWAEIEREEEKEQSKEIKSHVAISLSAAIISIFIKSITILFHSFYACPFFLFHALWHPQSRCQCVCNSCGRRFIWIFQRFLFPTNVIAHLLYENVSIIKMAHNKVFYVFALSKQLRVIFIAMIFR